MTVIKTFNELSAQDVAQAGGKGASLGEMTRAGVPVPGGFVILASVFEKFLEETDIGIEIGLLLSSVNYSEIHSAEYASGKIQSLILGATLPANIAEEIRKAHQTLGTQYVAVRSSATAEDSGSAAWAGQLESYLNTTKDTLLNNVQRCWASLFTPRAIFYRLEKKLGDKHIAVAVVIQKMVQSEVSGIAFSVHPITEDRNQLIIEASYGLGEAIVSGQVTPDAYVVEKEPRNILDKKVVAKERGLYMTEGGKNDWVSINEERAGKQALTDNEILQLSELVLSIERHYGFPCDIEWAFEAGKFYIVQSRPITTLVK